MVGVEKNEHVENVIVRLAGDKFQMTCLKAIKKNQFPTMGNIFNARASRTNILIPKMFRYPYNISHL